MKARRLKVIVPSTSRHDFAMAPAGEENRSRCQSLRGWFFHRQQTEPPCRMTPCLKQSWQITQMVGDLWNACQKKKGKDVLRLDTTSAMKLWTKSNDVVTSSCIASSSNFTVDGRSPGNDMGIPAAAKCVKMARTAASITPKQAITVNELRAGHTRTTISMADEWSIRGVASPKSHSE